MTRFLFIAALFLVTASTASADYILIKIDINKLNFFPPQPANQGGGGPGMGGGPGGGMPFPGGIGGGLPPGGIGGGAPPGGGIGGGPMPGGIGGKNKPRHYSHFPAVPELIVRDISALIVTAELKGHWAGKRQVHIVYAKISRHNLYRISNNAFRLLRPCPRLTEPS